MRTDTMTVEGPKAEAIPGNRVRVWDPLVRIFHWSLVAGFATAYLVEDEILALHVWAGYLVLGLVGVRVLWGFVGTRHARFTDFVRSPRAILNYLRDALRWRAPRYLGHNPAGGAMVVALLLSVAATGVSGLALFGAQEFAGPMAELMRGVSNATAHDLEEVHEFFANLTLVLILAHLAGVLFSSLEHEENLVLSMIDGIKRSTDTDGDKTQ
ncbi:cytochrome b/b6 domain-containing protein [Imhoffiella purpurea]|uniref:Ni,Fe-hydrogenase I cytochrome b subunit n=1 Tax=Imhoffiella purpurea TaxID=1249627 RepID=W9VYW4_9GAMM|nr:cytochrome b/b6 domain-containing protein [Imhoffiella purpurea]EXJ15600.1 Ni,Fe-hydrogenase I cytochrome b subunit [Imhoffiella purpurea]